MAKRFEIGMENAGFNEVMVTVHSDQPIEFLGATSVMGNKAVYKNGTEVKFRLAGTEPTEWFSALAMRKSFDTASRFFERGV